MNGARPRLYIFGWPSFLGGADTKLAHLLGLLHEHCQITCVPNENRHLHNKTWTRYLDTLGVKYASLQEVLGTACGGSMPPSVRQRQPSQSAVKPGQSKSAPKLEGVALSLCNQCFFTHRIAQRARERGLKIIWSSEMMWHHEGELEAVREGVVDVVLYTSEFQKRALEPGYVRELRSPKSEVRNESEPPHVACYEGGMKWAMTGNYIDPTFFPFKERRNATFTIGRLSRPDPLKYPEDFPVFYERLQLPEVRFRVMAWDHKLSQKYRWHNFDGRWELLPPEKESQVDFLHSLDLFVYPLGHNFRESWGRSTVEAMLTGCIPLVPSGHHLDKLVVQGETGYVCSDFLEWKECAQRLFSDYPLRQRMAQQCREHAEKKVCNREEHLQVWLEALGLARTS